MTIFGHWDKCGGVADARVVSLVQMKSKQLTWEQFVYMCKAWLPKWWIQEEVSLQDLGPTDPDVFIDQHCSPWKSLKNGLK
jgi:hypothetical protein